MFKRTIAKLNLKAAIRYSQNKLLSNVSSAHSFAFSGCGWLTPFHLGVVNALRENMYINESTVVAGTSGGALSALLACSGVSTLEALENIVLLSQNQKFRKNIHSGLRVAISNLLPDDAVVKCNGRLHVVVTRAWPQPKITPIIISNFSSKEDILDAVTTSCFIPLYSDKSLFIPYREGKYLDGGLLAFMPPVGQITVSPFHRRYVLRRPPQISPHLSSKFKYSLPRLLSYVLRPAPPDVLRDLYQEGNNCALSWIHADKKETPNATASLTSASKSNFIRNFFVKN